MTPWTALIAPRLCEHDLAKLIFEMEATNDESAGLAEFGIYDKPMA